MTQVPSVGLPLLSPGDLGRLPRDVSGEIFARAAVSVGVAALGKVIQASRSDSDAETARELQIWEGKVIGARKTAEFAAADSDPSIAMQAYDAAISTVREQMNSSDLTPDQVETVFARQAGNLAASRSTTEFKTRSRRNDLTVREANTEIITPSIPASVSGNLGEMQAAQVTIDDTITRLVESGSLTIEDANDLRDDVVKRQGKAEDEFLKASKDAARANIVVWKEQDAAFYAEDMTQETKNELNDKFRVAVGQAADSGFITQEYAELQSIAHESRLEAVEDDRISRILADAKFVVADPRSPVALDTLLAELQALPDSTSRTRVAAQILKLAETEEETYTNAEQYLQALDANSFTEDTPTDRNTREAAYKARTNRDDPVVMAATALAMREAGHGLPDAFRQDLSVMAGGREGRDATGARLALGIIQETDPAQAASIAEGIGVRARMLLYVSADDARIMDREGATNALADANLYLSGDAQLDIDPLPINKNFQDTNNLKKAVLTGDQLNNWVAKYRMEFIRMMTVEGRDESDLPAVRDQASRRASLALKAEFTPVQFRGQTQLTPIDNGITQDQMTAYVRAAELLATPLGFPRGGFVFGNPSFRTFHPRPNLAFVIGDEVFGPIVDDAGNLRGVFVPSQEFPDNVIVPESREWPVMLKAYRTGTPPKWRRVDADIVYDPEGGFIAIDMSEILFQRANDVFAERWFEKNGDMPREPDLVEKMDEYNRQFAEYVTGDPVAEGLGWPRVFFEDPGQ